MQKVGSFQLNTVTGNKSVTGLGFQPKLLIFFHTPDTVDIVNQTANHNWAMGATDGTNQFALCTFSANGNSVGESAYGAHCLTNCIVGSIDSVTSWRATIVSMDGDGFTINQPTAPPVGVRVGYLALGGTLTGWQVGAFQAGTVGSQSVTGLGFQPSGLLAFTAGAIAQTTNPPNLNGNVSNSLAPCFGFTDGVNQRSHGVWYRGSSLTVKSRGRECRNDSLIAAPYLTTPSTTHAVWLSLSSFDANGFTFTNNINNGNRWVYYVTFAGAQTRVDNIFSPTGAGPFSISGLPFDPASILMASTWQANYNVFEGFGVTGGAPGALLSVGAATQPTEQITIGLTTKDFTTTTVEGHHSESTKIMRRFAHDPFTTLQMDFAHLSMSSGAVNFNCTTPSGTTSRVSYMAIEGAPFVPPSDPTGGSGGPDSPDSSFLFNMIGV